MMVLSYVALAPLARVVEGQFPGRCRLGWDGGAQFPGKCDDLGGGFGEAPGGTGGRRSTVREQTRHDRRITRLGHIGGALAAYSMRIIEKLTARVDLSPRMGR
jgi:hypothetical protein